MQEDLINKINFINDKIVELGDLIVKEDNSYLKNFSLQELNILLEKLELGDRGINIISNYIDIQKTKLIINDNTMDIIDKIIELES